MYPSEIHWNILILKEKLNKIFFLDTPFNRIEEEEVCDGLLNKIHPLNFYNWIHLFHDWIHFLTCS